jgi:acetyl esterase/lipase
MMARVSARGPTGPATSRVGARLRGGLRRLRNRPSLQGVDVVRDVTFADPDPGGPLRLDVFRPSDGAVVLRPSVVTVHGGGFAAGSRRWVGAVSAELARRGYVTFAIQYRFGPGFAFPAPFDDLAAAVAWVRGHGAAHGADPDRIGLLGSSAGASLALLGATKGWPGVRAAVSWSGMWSLEDLDAEPGPDPERIWAAVESVLGCRRCPERWAEASARANAGPSTVPIMMVNATHELVPALQARRADEDLTRLGIEHRVLLLSGHAHGMAYRRRAVGPSADFLGEHLRP